LKKFKSQLNEIKNWKHDLSLGEQQLISFARVFLYQPDLIFLDEATSSLDEHTEFHIYTSLKTHLPQTTLISVAHRSSVRVFHDVVIDFNQFSQLYTEIDEITEKDSIKLFARNNALAKSSECLSNPIRNLSWEQL
jgi:ABC-type uncharacterized transport system fused permease/ATPase subunit